MKILVDRNIILLDEEILIIKDKIFLLKYENGEIEEKYEFSIHDIEKIYYDDNALRKFLRENMIEIRGSSENMYKPMTIKVLKKIFGYNLIREYSFGYKLEKKEFLEINKAISQYISDYKKKRVENIGKYGSNTQ